MEATCESHWVEHTYVTESGASFQRVSVRGRETERERERERAAKLSHSALYKASAN